MPHLKRGDANLYYEDDGKGTAILMTHGFVASTGMWDGQVEAVSYTHLTLPTIYSV